MIDADFSGRGYDLRTTEKNIQQCLKIINKDKYKSFITKLNEYRISNGFSVLDVKNDTFFPLYRTPLEKKIE